MKNRTYSKNKQNIVTYRLMKLAERTLQEVIDSPYNSLSHKNDAFNQITGLMMARKILAEEANLNWHQIDKQFDADMASRKKEAQDYRNQAMTHNLSLTKQ